VSLVGRGAIDSFASHHGNQMDELFLAPQLDLF
jgi:hypothetical protein